MLSHCRVVLVRAEVAGNIGATARAMRNFGLSNLVLVAPVADHLSHESRQRSTHGEAILNSATIVSDLHAAVHDCLVVVGTTARAEGLIREGLIGPPDRIASKIVNHLSQGQAAIVFGPEPNGLTTQEASRCDHLIEIPTSSDYPALNLSHAAAICLYELRRQFLFGKHETASEPPASHAERDRMYEHLRAALTDIHFLYNEKADLLMHAVRQLINRAEPTVNDVKLLRGIASQMEWVVRNKYRAPDA